MNLPIALAPLELRKFFPHMVAEVLVLVYSDVLAWLGLKAMALAWLQVACVMNRSS